VHGERLSGTAYRSLGLFNGGHDEHLAGSLEPVRPVELS
jgi:hypothetical protein